MDNILDSSFTITPRGIIKYGSLGGVGFAVTYVAGYMVYTIASALTDPRVLTAIFEEVVRIGVANPLPISVVVIGAGIVGTLVYTYRDGIASIGSNIWNYFWNRNSITLNIQNTLPSSTVSNSSIVSNAKEQHSETMQRTSNISTKRASVVNTSTTITNAIKTNNAKNPPQLNASCTTTNNTPPNTGTGKNNNGVGKNPASTFSSKTPITQSAVKSKEVSNTRNSMASFTA